MKKVLFFNFISIAIILSGTQTVSANYGYGGTGGGGGGWLPPVVVAPKPIVTTSMPARYNFTKDLQFGSKGNDVTELQKVLVAGGYLIMPSGVAYGEFGSLTKFALIRYQKAKGITPASGYFGPKTRQILNSSTSSTTSIKDMTLKQLIEMLLQIGAIASDKIDAAKKLVGIQ